jgi:hypothetical protein
MQQALLSKGSENKHFSTARMKYNNNGNPNRYERNNVTATDELCFLHGPCRNVISRKVSESQLIPRGGGVALRVVGGDEKGSLESETVEYSRESHGTRTRD